MPAMKTIVLLSLLIGAPAWADESAIKLKDGAGRDLVEKNCVACHSLDYIPMNSPFLDRKGWEASVTKMIKAMGAPVAADDVPGLVDYLVRNYGKP
jgi:mono/diheme cytochrome c family protein